RLMVKILLQTAQDILEGGIAVNNLADGMHQVVAFVVHILGALFVDAIGTNDGAVVVNEFTEADSIFGAGLFTEAALGINRFGIAGKAFVYPHIGNVVGGNIVAPPFVRAFEDDDEIPFEPPAGARKVSAQLAILKMI